jgi:hypothetical protein
VVPYRLKTVRVLPDGRFRCHQVPIHSEAYCFFSVSGGVPGALPVDPALPALPVVSALPGLPVVLPVVPVLAPGVPGVVVVVVVLSVAPGVLGGGVVVVVLLVVLGGVAEVPAVEPAPSFLPHAVSASDATKVASSTEYFMSIPRQWSFMNA